MAAPFVFLFAFLLSCTFYISIFSDVILFSLKNVITRKNEFWETLSTYGGTETSRRIFSPLHVVFFQTFSLEAELSIKWATRHHFDEFPSEKRSSGDSLSDPRVSHNNRKLRKPVDLIKIIMKTIFMINLTKAILHAT